MASLEIPEDLNLSNLTDKRKLAYFIINFDFEYKFRDW